MAFLTWRSAGALRRTPGVASCRASWPGPRRHGGGRPANLLHDKVRCLITLAGITVAIVLIFLQGGCTSGS